MFKFKKTGSATKEEIVKIQQYQQNNNGRLNLVENTKKFLPTKFERFKRYIKNKYKKIFSRGNENNKKVVEDRNLKTNTTVAPYK